MQINLIHSNRNILYNLVKPTLNNVVMSDIFFDGYNYNCRLLNKLQDYIWALPYQLKTNSYSSEIVFYQNRTLLLSDNAISKVDQWLIICDGEVVTFQNVGLLNLLLDDNIADVITVTIVPELKANSEKITITSKGQLAGIRRYYHDSVQLAEMPGNWPHYTFIKKEVIERVLVDNSFSVDFDQFKDICKNNSVKIKNFKIGGDCLDLKKELPMLKFLQKIIVDLSFSPKRCLAKPSKVKLFGKVLLGENVSLGENSIIVGPAIITDNLKIPPNTVIRHSVICFDKYLSAGSVLRNKIITNIDDMRDISCKTNYCMSKSYVTSLDTEAKFRNWSVISYPRLFKRIFDIAAAVIVLTLFLPIFPFICLAIKLNMPGPIFFKHRRQGLRGRAFNCIKFRTMIVDADKIQNSLRIQNQVDGPQFKIEDDPRVTSVGNFLRNTFIDEIPQFINILLGQMSLIGPRPSPENENTLCPFWRDARLSVKPGITGLWQVLRTRQQGQDFQEWIYYDIKYVRDVSFLLDLKICLLTIKKLIKSFVEQF